MPMRTCGTIPSRGGTQSARTIRSSAELKVESVGSRRADLIVTESDIVSGELTATRSVEKTSTDMVAPAHPSELRGSADIQANYFGGCEEGADPVVLPPEEAAEPEVPFMASNTDMP